MIGDDVKLFAVDIAFEVVYRTNYSQHFELIYTVSLGAIRKSRCQFIGFYQSFKFCYEVLIIFDIYASYFFLKFS